MNKLFSILPILFPTVLAVPPAGISQDEVLDFEVHGYVRLDDGSPVAGTVLQLLYLVGVEPTGETTESFLSASTDNDGFYSLKFRYSSEMKELRLHFSSLNVDTYRYEAPVVKNLQTLIMQRVEENVTRLGVNWVFQTRKTWAEEVELLERYGEDSEKGKLIKLRGIPDQVKSFKIGSELSGEIWFYYTDGLAIRFIGDIRDKDFHFKPQ